MKPTTIQIKVIGAIIDQLNFWRGTNDIDSPTHYCDMDECYFSALEDCLSEKEIEELTSETCNLFQFIKNLAV
jgi:hypothetical protein